MSENNNNNNEQLIDLNSFRLFYKLRFVIDSVSKT